MPNENAIIAEWLAAHGHPELAWDEEKVACPNGHVYGPTGFRIAQDPCPECDTLLDIIPKDFTQPAPLLAAVEAWLLGDEENRLEIYPPTAGDGWVAVLWSEVGRFHYERKGQTLCEALLAALAAAMEAEQGESHGER